jgi:hypothetical protein
LVRRKTPPRARLRQALGDHAYAAEELVAEIGAAFLCAELQITQDTRADHAQYLPQWLQLIKGDPRAIFAAAAKASDGFAPEAPQCRSAVRGVMRLARPELRPRQRYANIVQVIMRDPQFVRPFRQGRKISCDPAQHGVKFKPCGTQQFTLRN